MFRKRIFKQIIASVPIVLLIACASSSKMGTEEILDEETLSQIKVGVSTREDVKALLGTPSSFMFTDNDEEVWTYHFMGTKRKQSMLGYIPRVGGILSTAERMKGSRQKDKGYVLTVRFTKDGIVKRFGRGETAYESEQEGVFN